MLATVGALVLVPSVEAQTWLDLGNALPGSAGTPQLVGQGTLIGGTHYSLELTGAAPASQAFLVFGQSQLLLPIAGGTLVPSPDLVAGPLETGAGGGLAGEFTWPVGMPAGVQDFWQVWIADAGAPGGWSASNALRSTTPTQLGGTFPDDWIYGGDCANDPLIQVHRYNQDTFILRQSMCTNFEGPFMYLLFGQDKVLLEDTGAGGIPIAATVYSLIDTWLLEQGKTSIELIVAHSHGHGDHIQGDGQFNGQPNTTVVGTSMGAVANFFGIGAVTDVVTYDLGGRVLDVMAIPGHQSAHIALYDRNTALLLTGDSLYPGFIFLSSSTWNDFRDSISRLRDFVEDKPVAWVMGTHVEMKSTPFEAYTYGTKNQPEERDPQLEKKHLQELDEALDQLPTATTEVHADFIING
ncbi:MBL fold metallo-hydrolase [Engelhardtia mirabilis]|uniref:MBL fold metallo-hydrolase n=1 Tax=Engelhardtia mirabilis TaxID=2528011 RepID=UPI003AF3330A